jgi:Polysaccharide pyruvyl transferase
LKALIVGWFSFEEGHATAGDLLACDLVREWLEHAGYSCEIALAAPFSGGISLRSAEAKNYALAVFVCGPFERKGLESEFLSRFASCHVIGLNLTMPIPLDQWNPFDLLIERDSSVCSHPDMVFLSKKRLVPVVGRCLVEPYQGAIDDLANAAIDRLTGSREMVVIPIDTRLDANSTGLKSPAEVESLLARMDVVITTRLHGMVLALKNSVPVIAIDPEAGGAKVIRQAKTIGWRLAYAADAVNDQILQQAFEYCLTDQARSEARQCSERAVTGVESMRRELLMKLRGSISLPGPKHLERKAFAASFGWNQPVSMRHQSGLSLRALAMRVGRWRPKSRSKKVD